MVHEQPEPHLPVQQRRAEPAHRVDLAVGQQRARRLACALRAGAVDARPADAAGRAAVRQRLQLVPRAAGRADEIPADGRSRSRKRKGVDSYKDITPRMGVAYDVFGNGKTAVKVNLGKYLEGVGVQLNYANSNPTLRFPPAPVRSARAGVTRTWTDANGNFQPDCDLLNPNAQDLRATRRRFLRRDLEPELRTERLDQQLRSRRCSTGGASARRTGTSALSVQQQLLPRASVEVAYSRRWYRRLHRERQPGACRPPTTRRTASTAPLDSRLPGGGGYTVSGLYDVNPADVRTDQQPRRPTREQVRQRSISTSTASTSR